MNPRDPRHEPQPGDVIEPQDGPQRTVQGVYQDAWGATRVSYTTGDSTRLRHVRLTLWRKSAWGGTVVHPPLVWETTLLERAKRHVGRDPYPGDVVTGSFGRYQGVTRKVLFVDGDRVVFLVGEAANHSGTSRSRWIDFVYYGEVIERGDLI